MDVVAVWEEWGGGWVVLGFGVGERGGVVVWVVIRVEVELVEALLALLGASPVPALVVELEVD